MQSITKRLMSIVMPYASALPKPIGSSQTQPFTVIVEGNIGSGKTTFINHFQKFHKDVCIVHEPVDKWRDLNGTNLLELMYKDPQRWLLPFQSYVTLTMLEGHLEQTDKPIKLMERSIFSSRFCFVENSLRSNMIHKGMYDVLTEWYKFIEKNIQIRADLIIYLRTSPEVAYERTKKRSRHEESEVPLEYIENLHELHEDWLVRKRFGSNIKVLEIEANLDLDDIKEEYKRSESFITSLQQQPPMITVSPSKATYRST